MSTSAVLHERSLETVMYMAKAISVRDLVEQVTKKCSDGTPIPFEQWVRLQFCPKNPRTKAAAQYRKQLNLSHFVCMDDKQAN